MDSVNISFVLLCISVGILAGILLEFLISKFTNKNNVKKTTLKDIKKQIEKDYKGALDEKGNKIRKDKDLLKFLEEIKEDNVIDKLEEIKDKIGNKDNHQYLIRLIDTCIKENQETIITNLQPNNDIVTFDDSLSEIKKQNKEIIEAVDKIEFKTDLQNTQTEITNKINKLETTLSSEINKECKTAVGILNSLQSGITNALQDNINPLKDTLQQKIKDECKNIIDKLDSLEQKESEIEGLKDKLSEATTTINNQKQVVDSLNEQLQNKNPELQEIFNKFYDNYGEKLVKLIEKRDDSVKFGDELSEFFLLLLKSAIHSVGIAEHFLAKKSVLTDNYDLLMNPEKSINKNNYEENTEGKSDNKSDAIASIAKMMGIKRDLDLIIGNYLIKRVN